MRPSPAEFGYGGSGSPRHGSAKPQTDLGVEMRNKRSTWHRLPLAGGLSVGLTLIMLGTPTLSHAPIKIGHVAALSGASAQSGEALARARVIATPERNGKVGRLGGRTSAPTRR